MSPGVPQKAWKRSSRLLLWAQFLWALGFVKVLGLSERARFTLAAYHRPLGFGITIAGLTTVLVRPAKDQADQALLVSIPLLGSKCACFCVRRPRVAVIAAAHSLLLSGIFSRSAHYRLVLSGIARVHRAASMRCKCCT